MKITLDQNVAIRSAISNPIDREEILRAVEDDKIIAIDLETADGKALAYQLDKVKIDYKSMSEIVIYNPKIEVKRVPAPLVPTKPNMFQYPKTVKGSK